MDRTAKPPFPGKLTGLAAVLLLAAASFASAQPSRPGRGGESVAFEVQSIDPQSWVVTARDVESGEEFSFRLPPESFRGQRFKADLGGARAGRRITVEAPRVRMDQAVVERPLRGGARLNRSAEGPLGFGRSQPPGQTGPPRTDSRTGSPGRSPLLGRGSTGPMDYEVVSVDPRSWQVEARGSDGSEISFEVDPKAFVGFRFEASVESLRAGQGFELLATNERPLADCCVVKSLPRR